MRRAERTPACTSISDTSSSRPMRRLVDLAAAWLARAGVRGFFRTIEIEGLDRFPRGCPVLVVANHPNGLIDPTLLVGLLPVKPKFIGAIHLWRILPLRPFLALGGVIPVTRPGKDTAGGTANNAAMFDRCYAELASGGAIALFPEGISHGETF